MRLVHNLASLNVFRQYSKTLEEQKIAMKKVNSGYKINSAADDPNALAKSERLRMQIRGLNMASRNVQDGASMLQTAEGAMDSMTSMVHRMKELVIKRDNDSNNENDKEIINKEIEQLINGYNDIVKNTEFNGVKILGEEKMLQMPAGANVGEVIEFKVYDLNFKKVIGSTGTDKEMAENLNTEGIDKILDTIISKRSKYGALENKFEDIMGRLNEISLSLEGADSVVRDADVAEVSMTLAKDEVLVQAGNAMMVQTNKMPQDVLRILENVRAR